MFGMISFCVGNKTIEVNGQEFSLGELSADCLNITIPEYREMKAQLEAGQQKAGRYLASRDLDDWKACHQEFVHLEKMLCRFRPLRVIRGERSYLTNVEDFFKKRTEYEKEGMGTDYIWEKARRLYSSYGEVLSDIATFNDTIRRFMEIFLSRLEKSGPSAFVEALRDFLYDERSYKWIPGPLEQPGGFFTAADAVTLWCVPRETAPGSGVFKIYKCYEGYRLQTLLKMDFYGALEAGYTIRRCQYCQRFFLCKDGRRTKYCDRPAPGDPKHTCAQLGYRLYGIKETAGDDPRVCSLRRCRQRLDKDLSRRNITAEDRERLYRKAKDLFHQAETGPGVSFDRFEQSLAPDNLYALCGIQRKRKARGRPRKEGVV